MDPRIAPLSPPYADDVETSLAKWMPPGSAMEPLKLFRTIARHGLLSDRMRGLGSVFLGRGTLPLRTRELLILRTCARCHAEYEWGVHVTAFAAAAGLDEHTVRATALDGSVVPVGEAGGADALLLRFADELHDDGRVVDATWAALAEHYDAHQLLEMLALVGFYHLIAFVVNGTRVEREPWAARFPEQGDRKC